MIIIGLAILTIAIGLMIRQTFTREVPSTITANNTATTNQLQLSTPSTSDNGTLPITYSCRGANINPQLTIANVPPSTKELVLVMRQDEASQSDSKIHWTAWNIPPDTTTISENDTTPTFVQGVTDFGKSGYEGPCPMTKTGTHSYIFELFALNDQVNLDANASNDMLINAMNGKVVTKTQLTVQFNSDIL